MARGPGCVWKAVEIEKTRRQGKVLCADKTTIKERVMISIDPEGTSFKWFVAGARLLAAAARILNPRRLI